MQLPRKELFPEESPVFIPVSFFLAFVRYVYSSDKVPLLVFICLARNSPAAVRISNVDLAERSFFSSRVLSARFIISHEIIHPFALSTSPYKLLMILLMNYTPDPPVPLLPFALLINHYTR